MSCVVDCAIAVVVIANSAVKLVVLKDPVERLALGDIGTLAAGGDCHPSLRLGCARAHQFSVHFHHAGVARLDGPHLRVVANLREIPARQRSIHGLHQQFTGNGRYRVAVKSDGDIRMSWSAY